MKFFDCYVGAVMKELQFIIKFFGKMGYMDTFLKEQSFFACPAGYYCTIEGSDQGDEREASVISKPLTPVYKETCVYDIKRYRKEAFRKYKYEHIFTPVGIYYKNDFEEYDDGKYRIKIGTDD